MKNNIVVSTGYGRLHLYYAAIAAQEADLLHSMLTSIYLKKKWVPLINRIYQLSKKSSWKRLLLRRDDKIDENKVVSLISIEIMWRLSSLIKRIGVSTNYCFNIEKLNSLYYGSLANHYIKPPVRLIHSRSGFSRAIIPHAHKIGAKVLLEQSAAHPRFSYSILESEYEKWGVPQKYRTYVAPMREMEWDIKHSDYILTNSDFCASTIKPYILNQRNIKIVHTGVDIKAFEPSGDNISKKFTILFVGSLSSFKGVIYLILAFKNLALKNAELILIGGKHYDRPREIDKLSEYYTYISHVPHSEIPQFFSRANIFVFPSLAEGSARVVGEAMASGLPCIVTPNVGSIIQDGVEGFIVPPKDVDALAEKILLLYDNRELLVEMGRAARKTAVNKLTWKHYQENLIRVYKEILQETED